MTIKGVDQETRAWLAEVVERAEVGVPFEGCDCNVCALVRDKSKRRAEMAGDRWTWGDLAKGAAMIVVFVLVVVLMVGGWQ